MFQGIKSYWEKVSTDTVMSMIIKGIQSLYEEKVLRDTFTRGDRL